MPINIDFGGVDEAGGGGDYSPLDPGVYNATVRNIKQSEKAGPSGFHYIEFEFQLQDGNRRLWRNYSLSPKALWALKADLGKMGVKVSDGPFDLDPAEIIGSEVSLVVARVPKWDGSKNDDGSPVMTNEVNEVKAAGSSSSWGG